MAITFKRAGTRGCDKHTEVRELSSFDTQQDYVGYFTVRPLLAISRSNATHCILDELSNPLLRKCHQLEFGSYICQVNSNWRLLFVSLPSGLVEKQDGWIINQFQCDGKSLAFAPGQAGDSCSSAIRQAQRFHNLFYLSQCIGHFVLYFC